ncbi:hypothetical protein BDW71DRAFT_211602 [Aspergillus fruticulosus]
MAAQHDIAVIGYSIKLPGGVEDGLAFWQTLDNGQNLKTSWPESRGDLGFSGTDGHSTLPSWTGHFIEDDVRAFDAPFFSVTAREAASMDPLQRWTLEASYRAFEAAGISAAKLRGSRTAVFSASMLEDYGRLAAMDPDSIDRFAATGNAVSCIIPNRISWYFDLRGPSIHVNTACSSSLAAIDMACKTLCSGDASCAIVTGSNLLLDPTVFQMLSNQGFLSPDGLCYSFDHRANGYARGEGIIAVVLKPVHSAVRDGDMIRAVIRGVSSNQDGHTSVLTQPSPQSQEDLIRHVYRQAGLSLKDTRYVEAHGTGTPVGDPIEVQAIGRAFSEYRSSDSPLYVGSVKANIGHLEAASGLASLVKAILVLEKGTIPPNALFEKINVNIDTDRLHVAIPTQSVPWPSSGLRRISINSFGFGGSNSHMIVDDAFHYLRTRGLPGRHCTSPSVAPQAKGDASSVALDGIPAVESKEGPDAQAPVNGSAITSKTPKLLVWSAADEKATNRMIVSHISFYRDTISQDAERLSQLASTLATRRQRMLWRSFAVAQGDGSVSPAKPIRSSTETGLAFVFTGQGAQYVGMGSGLLAYPKFARTLEQIDCIYKSYGCPWSLFDELHRSENIDKPEYSQALSSAVQMALVELLKSFGIVPAAVVGHSSGEIAAAYTSGALSLESACKVAYFRGKLVEGLRLQSLALPGAMLSINIAEGEIVPYLQKGGPADLNPFICTACVNSPMNCTLSGPEWAIDAVKRQADMDGIFAQKLRTGVAYHSSYMNAIAEEYASAMGSLKGPAMAACAIPMVSSVTGQPVRTSSLTDPRYWVDNLVSPVRFADAIQFLASEETPGALGLNTVTDFVEIGPHPALRRPIGDTLHHAKSKARYASTLHRTQDSLISVMEASGKLFCFGYPVSIDAVNKQDSSSAFLVDCPPYPFDRSTYWHESRFSHDFRLRGESRKETLGMRVLDWNPLEPRWRNLFSVESNPWLGDHKISDVVLYPAAGMLVMAFEAVRQMAPTNRIPTGYRITRANFINPIIIPQPSDERVETQLRLQRAMKTTKLDPDASEYDVAILSYSQGQWTECFRADIVVEYQETPVDYVRHQYDLATEQCTYPIDSGAHYADAIGSGLQYGADFKLLKGIFWDGQGTAVANVDVTSKHRTDDLVHPAILDQAFHVLRVASGQPRAANVPVEISDAWFAASGWQDTPRLRWFATAARAVTSGERGSIHALAEDGSVLCSVQSVATAAVSGNTTAEGEDNQLLYSIEWKPLLSLLVPEQLRRLYRGTTHDEAATVANHALLREVLNIVTARTLNIIDRKKVPPALKKHVAWMERHVSKRVTPLQSQAAATMTEPELEDRLSAVEAVLPPWALYITCARKLPQILAGEIDPLQVVFESDQARIFYDHLFQALCANGHLEAYLDLSAHENPNLNILEVGAGTGGMTGHVLAALQRREARTGARSFATYTYTDISPAFFEKAHTLWPELLEDGRLKFSVLNVDEPIVSQGFTPGSYDIVIAASVLHATPDLEATIRNVRTALKPGGHLILLEPVSPDKIATNFMAGLVPGWWVAREEWRGHSAAVSEVIWDQILRANGFSGSDLVLRDRASEECHIMSIIVTTAVEPVDKGFSLPKPPVVLVIDGSQQQQELADTLGSELNRHGWPSISPVVQFDQIEHIAWDPETVAVCIAEVHNGPLLKSLSEKTFACLKRLTANPRLLWVTGTSISDPQYANYAAANGLLRCLRAEQPESHIVTLAIEDESDTTTSARWIEKILSEAFSRLSSEVEYVVRDGLILTGRAVKDVTGEAALRSLLEHRLSREVARNFPDQSTGLEPSEVEFGTCSCALAKEQDLATFAPGGVASVVTRLESACDRFNAGGRVYCASSTEGTERQCLRTQEKYAAEIPGCLSFDVATSLIGPGIAAYHSLIDLARIRQGDRVLIHPIIPNVGQIAAQIARMHGAHVLGTCLSNEKQFAVDALRFADEQLISIDPELSDEEVIRSVKDERVDIILSCIPDDGTVLRLLLECVEPGGHVVEVANMDGEMMETLSLADLPRNVSYSLLDPTSLRPADQMRLMVKVLHLTERGFIKPPRTISGSSAGAVADSVDSGKVSSALLQPWAFDKNASYLVVGGSGGLGRAIIQWMADRGAANIVLISRHGASSKAAAATVAEIEARGINIRAFACDAASKSELASVLATCTRSMPPIKGCINAAMVLQDAVFQDSMTFPQWDLTLRSKVQTSMNLHHLLGPDLDFFILLSSLIGVTGQMASANYAAGCAVQDALARYRVAHGQRAISLDLGWMRDVGIIAETAAYQRQRHAVNDMQPISARELLALLDLCLHPANSRQAQRQSQILFGLRTPADVLREGKRAPPHLTQPLLSQFSHPPTSPNPESTNLSTLESEIDPAALFQAASTPQERARIVLRALSVKLARAMSISPDDVEPHKGLSEYGVDSLMAVELRNWIVREFEAPVAVFDILGRGSIGEVVAVVVERSTVGFAMEG